MKRFLGPALAASAFAGVAVMWSAARWGVAVPQIAIFLLAATWTMDCLIHRRGVQFGWPAWPVLGILCCGAAQLVFHWTVYPWETGESMLYWLTNLLAVVMAMDVAPDRGARSRLLDALFFGGVALAVVSVIQVFTSEGYVFWIFAAPYREDVYGPFVARNQYAAFLEMLLPIAMVRAFKGEHKRWPYLVVSAVLYACAVASKSRAGVAVATAEVIVTAAILLAKKGISPRRMGKTAAAFLVVAGLLIAVVGPGVVWSRLRQQDPYSTRRDLLVSSIAMFRDRPLTGFGLGTWSTVYPAYAIDDDGLFANQAHNDWVQAAVEAGIPGLLLLSALFVWSVGAAWRTVWGIGIPFVLLHALVDYPIQRQALAVYFFLLAGIQIRTVTVKFPRTSADI